MIIERRVPEILEELSHLEVPVVDRAVFERLFGVRRRRAVQLMHFFGGYVVGRTFVIDRGALMRQLEPIQAGADFVMEQRRRQRLEEHLEKLRKCRAAAKVTLSVAPDARNRPFCDLPEGIELYAGMLRIEFCKAEELLGRLFELSQAAANDYEAFRSVAEGR